MDNVHDGGTLNIFKTTFSTSLSKITWLRLPKFHRFPSALFNKTKSFLKNEYTSTPHNTPTTHHVALNRRPPQTSF
jgi:hypothetical protein